MATELPVQSMQVFARTKKFGPGLTCIDLFSGAGGIAVGFREAGWCVRAANDIDAAAGKTFRLNFPEASFFEGPISALSSSEMLRACNLKRGELDCLLGGPPCQSFSYNNHQRSAKDARAKLFRDYLRLVADLNPKTLVMENVPGILTIGDNAVIKEIKRKLKALGYDCAIGVLSAEEFGAPQRRRRVFIVASRVGSASELLPVATHRSARLTKKSRADVSLPRPVTVGQAIGDLPPLKSGESYEVRKYTRKPKTPYQVTSRKRSRVLRDHVCHDLSPAMLKRIGHVPEGGNWRDIPRRLLTAGMRRARKSDHTKRYGRLRRSGLASTLLTKCDPHWGAYIHPTEDRTISVREAARLQGFPDVFRFADIGTTKQYAQVGNAVPVQVARALGLAAAAHINIAKGPPSRVRQG